MRGITKCLQILNTLLAIRKVTKVNFNMLCAFIMTKQLLALHQVMPVMKWRDCLIGSKMNRHNVPGR